MMQRRRAIGLPCAAAVAIPLLLAPALTRAGAGAAAPDDDWTSYAGSAEQHFSSLSDINDGNVSRLGLISYHDIETGPRTAYTTPLAVSGVVYFGAGYSVIHAVDAETGKQLWQYDPEAWRLAGVRMRAAWGIRGIAYSGGRIFTGTLDGRLLALDAKSGKLLWSANTVSKNDGRYITGAPWVYGDSVVIGHGGADVAPVRGYVTAYDQATGRQRWRFHTVPGDPRRGFENRAMAMAARTWTGQWWKFGGGGTVWNAMAYDARFNRLYIGTGNGAPWNRKIRSPGGGDNLFLSSIVALDADTGAYVWHYQVNPGESWDYNASMDIELADLRIGDRVRPVILHAPKNGFFYVIDRETGKLVSAEKFVDANWADRIDTKSGRPVETPIARFPGGQPVLLFPSSAGAHAAEAMSFSPQTGLVYIPAINQGRVYVDAPGDLSKWRYADGERVNTGLGPNRSALQAPPPKSALIAWDPMAQRPAWAVRSDYAKGGAVAATGGNLVIQGQADGYLNIYAADSGRKLWSFFAQTGVMSQPITYRAHGRQYISVIAGWRSAGPTGLPKEWDYYQQKWRLLTFALDGHAALPPDEPSEAVVMTGANFSVDPKKADHGAMVFAQRCYLCHGANMISGGGAPDLRKASSPLSIEALTAILRGGALEARGMPRFGELSRRDIEGLQHFIRHRANESGVTR